jgi:folate-binding protein YgfZ
MATASTPPLARTAHLPERGLIGLGGADVRNFLQNLVSNDIRKLSPFRSLYALLLTPQGKFLHDFFISELPDEETQTAIVLECERGRVDDLIRRLTLYRLRSAVVLNDLSDTYAVHTIFGDGAASGFRLAPEAGCARVIDGSLAFVDPRIADAGVRAILRSGSTALLQNFSLATADEYDSHRLALGLPDGSRDLEIERTFPLEAGLDYLGAIDYGKGCYVGQELTSRTHYRGTIRKRLFPVRIEGATPGPGAEIHLGGRKVGTMRSARGGRGIAMLRFEQVVAAKKSGEPFTSGDARVYPEIQDSMLVQLEEAEHAQAGSSR